MALLLEENRRLKDSLCQLQGDNERLNRAVGEARDELLAARLNVRGRGFGSSYRLNVRGHGFGSV